MTHQRIPLHISHNSHNSNSYQPAQAAILFNPTVPSVFEPRTPPQVLNPSHTAPKILIHQYVQRHPANPRTHSKWRLQISKCSLSPVLITTEDSAQCPNPPNFESSSSAAAAVRALWPGNSAAPREWRRFSLYQAMGERRRCLG